jgi:hypothetical protein
MLVDEELEDDELLELESTELLELELETLLELFAGESPEPPPQPATKPARTIHIANFTLFMGFHSCVYI